MFYKLLGMLGLERARKVVLRRKYGPTYVPAPVLAGAVVAAGLRRRPAVRQARLAINAGLAAGSRPGGSRRTVWDHGAA